MCGCVISDTRGGESPTTNQPTGSKTPGEPDTRDRHTILTNHRKTNLRAHSSDLSPHPHRLTSHAPDHTQGTTPEPRNAPVAVATTPQRNKVPPGTPLTRSRGLGVYFPMHRRFGLVSYSIRCYTCYTCTLVVRSSRSA